MYRISQFKIYIDELTIPNSSGRANNEEYKFLYRGISSLFGVRSSNIKELIIKRKSIDARKGKRAAYIYTFDVDIEGYDINLSKLNKVIRKRNMTVNLLTKPDKCFEPIIDSFISSGTNINSPVIVGAGPAGLFCGYVLALNGLKPIIIEQGSRIEERIKTVNSFWNNETKLNPYCNVSFGEGGAGTFSDGKLNTSVKDSFGRIEFVKNVFIQHGAPKEIGYLAKPHIGTDELRNVIINLRNSISSLGGTVLFDTCMTNVNIQDGKVNSIDVLNTIDDSKNNIQCDNLVLAIGHSARNTYCMLKDKVHMEQKDFAIGLRVEHPQDFIGLTQYGELYNMLPSADYKLRYHASNDRAVYSFCMCPGGHVVNASSEAEGSVTNGMSDHNRNSGFANSAIVVNVTQDDFEGDDVLAGMEFQKKWEQKAYEIANGMIPVSTFGSFRQSVVDADVVNTSNAKGKCMNANLREALPDYVSDAIEEAMIHFDSKLKGYGADNVVLYGVETRTSAPVRIVRDENGQADIKGIYPCGEGAGYAGGIMSAAVDGIKIAHKIVNALTL